MWGLTSPLKGFWQRQTFTFRKNLAVKSWAKFADEKFETFWIFIQPTARKKVPSVKNHFGFYLQWRSSSRGPLLRLPSLIDSDSEFRSEPKKVTITGEHYFDKQI